MDYTEPYIHSGSITWLTTFPKGYETPSSDASTMIVRPASYCVHPPGSISPKLVVVVVRYTRWSHLIGRVSTFPYPSKYSLYSRDGFENPLHHILPTWLRPFRWHRYPSLILAPQHKFRRHFVIVSLHLAHALQPSNSKHEPIGEHVDQQ